MSVVDGFRASVATGTEDINKLLREFNQEERTEDDELVFAAITTNVDLFIAGLSKTVRTELEYRDVVSNEPFNLSFTNTTLTGAQHLLYELTIEEIDGGFFDCKLL